MSDTATCSRCFLPIHYSDSLEHKGMHTSHKPDRCVELLRARGSDLQSRLDAELKNRDKSVDYAIALQRAIEARCRGEDVPAEVAEKCPHHARKHNDERLAALGRLDEAEKAAVALSLQVGLREELESRLDSGNERFTKMVTGLTEEIAARHELLRAIKADLDMRAKNGVVELSATIWNRLCVQVAEATGAPYWLDKETVAPGWEKCEQNYVNDEHGRVVESQLPKSQET